LGRGAGGEGPRDHRSRRSRESRGIYKTSRLTPRTLPQAEFATRILQSQGAGSALTEDERGSSQPGPCIGGEGDSF
jgi:hypothetical protein